MKTTGKIFTSALSTLLLCALCGFSYTAEAGHVPDPYNSDAGRLALAIGEVIDIEEAAPMTSGSEHVTSLYADENTSEPGVQMDTLPQSVAELERADQALTQPVAAAAAPATAPTHEDAVKAAEEAADIKAATSPESAAYHPNFNLEQAVPDVAQASSTTLPSGQAAAHPTASSAFAPSAAEQPTPRLEPDTINVNGTVLNYTESFETAAAPKEGAGLWLGSDSTTDGSWGYFIGHNPGPFTCVMKLHNGDPVTVCDSQGAARTYHVIDSFVVPDTTYWDDIAERVTGHGESVILQTCCGDNATYRIVVAA